MSSVVQPHIGFSDVLFIEFFPTSVLGCSDLLDMCRTYEGYIGVLLAFAQPRMPLLPLRKRKRKKISYPVNPSLQIHLIKHRLSPESEIIVSSHFL